MHQWLKTFTDYDGQEKNWKFYVEFNYNVVLIILGKFDPDNKKRMRFNLFFKEI